MKKLKLMLLVVAAFITTTMTSCLGDGEADEIVYFGAMTIKQSGNAMEPIYFYASNGAIFVPQNLNSETLAYLMTGRRGFIKFSSKDDLSAAEAGKKYYVDFLECTPMYDAKNIESLDTLVSVVEKNDSITQLTQLWVDPGFVNINITAPYKYDVNPKMNLAFNKNLDVVDDTLKLHLLYDYNISDDDKTNMSADMTLSFGIYNDEELKAKFADRDSIIVCVDARVSSTAGTKVDNTFATTKKLTFKASSKCFNLPY